MKTKRREWLVIESSKKNGVFCGGEMENPTHLIPKDVAEKLLGRKLDGVQWFTAAESKLLQEQSEWMEAKS